METNKRAEGLIKHELHDGYESGGLVYFRFKNREMVAVIRDRSQFDEHRERGTSLQDYIDTAVSHEAYGAGLAIDELIPEKEAFVES